MIEIDYVYVISFLILFAIDLRLFTTCGKNPGYLDKNIATIELTDNTPAIENEGSSRMQLASKNLNYL